MQVDFRDHGMSCILLKASCKDYILELGQNASIPLISECVMKISGKFVLDRSGFQRYCQVKISEPHAGRPCICGCR